MSNQQNVPPILKQNIIELEETSKILIPNMATNEEKLAPDSFDNGRILLWKGVETNLFFVTGAVSPGSLYIFDYQSGTEKAKLVLNYKFGRTAVIVDVLYFPLDNSHPGVVVAVTDHSLEQHGNYLAYISLSTKCLLKSFYMPHPITALCSIIDGTADRSEFTRLASSFHDWQHILLVGCRFGYASLVNLDLSADDDHETFDFLQNTKESPSNKKLDETTTIRPIRLKKNIHLSKIFYDDKMFVFRADDGTTRCHTKEKVYVSALHWLHKSGVAIIGFNFGAIMGVSLRTSKVYSMYYIDGLVQHFAFQEPEEDPRPILYFWVSYNSLTMGATLLMCTVNFPKDEEMTKNSEEYTYLEPYFTPCMKWNPDNCTRLVMMRTICTRKQQHGQANVNCNQNYSLFVNENNNNASAMPVKDDSSLLFISWLERSRRGEMKIHGALFDLNAFYAKRLIPKIQPDSTIARQFPFIARFTSECSDKMGDHSRRMHSLLDIVPTDISQFAPPAFLKETIDQLYYPSTYHITMTCLSVAKVFQAKVRPIQVQLTSNLAQNIVKYFDSPHDPARWIYAIGLANSAPANNINEERACLLRVIVHSFFPGILSLIDSAVEHPDWLKFVQKWVWKEVEITKAKFDDLCSPLFSTHPHEPSPSARGFIQHARVFFKRASIIFEALNEKFSALAEHEKSRSIIVQRSVARQVRLYSAGIAFALVYNLLPVNKLNAQLYGVVVEQFSRRAEKARRFEKTLRIHTLVDDIIKSNADDDIWQGKTALEWYPPKDLKSFLPILLMVNITESAKLSLLGYYCLDLEAATLNFGSDVEAKDGNTPPSSSIRLIRSSTSSIDDGTSSQPFRSKKFFSFFLSFFLQEDFTIDEMNRIRTLWLDDKRDTEEIEMLPPQQSTTTQNDLVNGIENDQQLKWPTLGTAEDIKKYQEECLKLEWGIYKFNELILERKRYAFLLDLPPLKGNEPEFVLKCHAHCMDVRRRFPSLFKRAETLPNFILQRYSNKVRRAHDSNLFAMSLYPHQQNQKQPILPLNIKHRPSLIGESGESTGLPTTSSLFGKRPSSTAPTTSPIATNSDETDQYEEMPLTIATPRKRQRFALFESSAILPERSTTPPPPPSSSALNDGISLIERSPVSCNIVQKSSIKEKDWERISKVTQTPLSLRKSISQSRLPIRQHRSYLRDRARTTLFSGVNGKAPTNGGPPANATETTPPTGQRIGGFAVTADDQISPEPNATKPAQPPSILKSDKKQSRIPPQIQSTKPRLRFAQSLFTTEQIPSRTERAFDERQDTSFSNFASLSASESSASSASALQTGSGNSTQFGPMDASSLNSAPPTAAKVQSETEGITSGIPILSFDEPSKSRELPEEPSRNSPMRTLEPEEETDKSDKDSQQSLAILEQTNGGYSIAKDDEKGGGENTDEKDGKEEMHVGRVSMMEEQEEDEINGEEENLDGPQQREKEPNAEKKSSNNGNTMGDDGKEDKEEATRNGREEAILEDSTTTNWLKENLRQQQEPAALRRSTRVRKVTEHFEPELSPPRHSPSRLDRSPSRVDREKTPSEKTPPPPQTPPSSRKRGRPSSAQKKKSETLLPLTPKSQRKKEGPRPSQARKDTHEQKE